MRRITRWSALALIGFLAGACTDENTSTDVRGPVLTPAFSTNVIINPATINGAYWFPRYNTETSVGTGVIRPFLDMQASPYEEGFNTDNDTFLYDQHRTSDTNKLPLNYVPVINEPPVGLSREFVMDANESNSTPDPQFVINAFDLYLCDDLGAPMYQDYNDFATNGDCALVYELGADGPVLAADSTKGSGKIFDYRILIPEQDFQDAADLLGVDLCPYLPTEAGELACGQYLILWSTMGDMDETSDYITDATFEEYSTIIRPYITVDKTVDVYKELTHDWALDKKVNDTDGPENIILPPGGSEDVDYAIEVDYLGATVTSASASGEITIANPASGGGGKKNDPLVVTSIMDEMNPGGLTPDLTCTDPDGGDLTLPLGSGVELAGGESIVCSWSQGGLDADTDYENTVSVELESLTAYDKTVPVTFDAVPAENISQVDETVDFVDIVPAPDGTETALGSCTAPASGDAADDPDCTPETGIGLDSGPPPAFTYSITVSDPGDCESQRVNRAKIVQTGYYDDAELNVSCFVLTVTKTADESFTRTHMWDLEKSVDPASWDLFDGESGTSDYGVDVTYQGKSDNDWRVQGTIQISSPAQAVPVTVQTVADVITGYGGATNVSCTGGLPQVINPGGVINCTYDTGEVDSEDSNPFGDTNTATATLSTGPSFEGTAPVSFGDPTSQVDQTVTIEDDVQGPLGECTAPADPAGDPSCTPEEGITFESPTFGYSITFECGADEGSHSNTADLYGDDSENPLDTDTEVVDVACYALTVTKTADESFERNWVWDIEKDFTSFFIDEGVTNLDCVPFGSEGNDYTCSASLLVGEELTAQYEVTVMATGSDTNWRVQGEITITNPNPSSDAELTGVADVISDTGELLADIGASVNCPSFVVPMNDGSDDGELVCTYDSGPQAVGTNPFGDLNTATATQQLYDYDSDMNPTADGTMDYEGTAPVEFPAAPSVENNECADVNDILPGFSPDMDFGTICATTFPNFEHTFDAYTRTFFTPDYCDATLTNTATVDPTDGGQEQSDSEQLIINCETGCTLTQGFWKTHSDQGPAPYADELWPLLGDYDGDGVAEEEEESLVGQDGHTFIENWDQPVKGNIWIKLAQQYQAAYLNYVVNGGAPAAVEQALIDARALLEADADQDIRNGDANASEANSLHSLLAAYNEGNAGVPHCSENTLPFLLQVFGS